MKRILFITLLLFAFINTIYAENNSKQIKTKVLILPFLNKNKVEKYDYLKDSIMNALNSELLRTGKFEFSGSAPQEINSLSINSTDYTGYINTILKKLKTFKTDEIVIGQYVIDNDKLEIDIKVFDQSTGSNIVSSSVKGELGVDIFRVIEESTKDITDKMINENSNHKKAIEFDIGGSLSLLYTNDVPLCSVDAITDFEKAGIVKQTNPYYYRHETFTEVSNYNKLFSGLGLQISVPFSFTYFPLNKFGAGFTSEIGVNLSYFVPTYSSIFEIFIKTLAEIKCGDIEKKRFFIGEIEFNFGTDFRTGCYAFYKWDLTYSYFKYEKFFIGPSLFLGFNRVYGKYFNYTIGGSFNLKISNYDRRDVDIDKNFKINDYVIETGIEFRWQYCYFKIN